MISMVKLRKIRLYYLRITGVVTEIYWNDRFVHQLACNIVNRERQELITYESLHNKMAATLMDTLQTLLYI